MTAIFTALSEAPKADVVRFALDKSAECHNLRRANIDLKRRMRALAIAAVIGMVLAFALGRTARAGAALRGHGLDKNPARAADDELDAW